MDNSSLSLSRLCYRGSDKFTGQENHDTNKVNALRSFFAARADDEIGLLAAVRPIAVIFVGPLICAFGDKHGVQQKVRTPAPRTHLKLGMVIGHAADRRV